MYIVCHFDTDEPEPPIRGGYKLWKTYEEAYALAKNLAQNWMFNREEIEGPFNFLKGDEASCKLYGYSRVFESRDYYIWIEALRGI